MGGAGTPSAQQQPKFTSKVEAVLVDVSVLDGDRRPFKGLTAADFTVLEDGKPQVITTFTAIDVPEAEPPSATWLTEVQQDYRTNTEDTADRRLVVIVMDDGLAMPAAEVLRARELAARTIERLAPDDLAAVVYTMDRDRGQDFTRDRSRLLASARKFTGGIDNIVGMDVNGAPTVIRFDQFDVASAPKYEATVGTLRGVAEVLASLPHKRKAVIYIGVGIPLDLGAAGPAEKVSAGEDGSVQLHSRDDLSGVAGQLFVSLLDVFRAAQRANVNIYCLDPGGLRPPEYTHNLLGGSGQMAASPGNLNADFLKAVSANTGGFTVADTNDPQAGIAQVFRENGSYYLLGYQPALSRADGRFHRIEVRVNRPGLTVRARGGYYEPRPEKPKKAKSEPTAIDRAMSAIVPKRDFALQVTSAPFAVPGSRDAAVAVAVALRQSVPTTEQGRVENIEVVVRAYGEDGRQHASERLQARVVMRPIGGNDTAIEVFSRLRLKPGRYQLRIGAENVERGITGSVFADLDVPDFAGDRLSLSGTVLSAEPALTLAGRDKIAGLTSLVPTARRAFGHESRVRAALKVYQGGTRALEAVRLTSRIIDAGDQVRFDASSVIESERFTSSRAAEYTVDLPLTRLAPGEYLLAIGASFAGPVDGVAPSKGAGPALRQLRFAVR